MKNSTKFIITLVVFILMFILGWAAGWYFTKGTLPEDDNAEYHRIVDSLEQVIQERNRQYDSLYVLRNELELTVKDINDKLKALEKNYGQKVIDITTYTNPQLERFFSDRYGD